ncbi:replication initiator protein A [Fusobacterium ulcerans]|uniref:replication initiator protein A n=1 Tax=Fusobacterium ulcerans TaxID=861 RepID=UPI002E77D1D3|nr:replication initiator protein A [Fusobacterium ulcerans]MEE0139000.1 replication initiator protein A [Fusobacterium ulcerans]
MRSIEANDLDSMVYYQVPKWLMDLLIEGKISIGAFKTYVLMYERTRLSARNKWIDEKGKVYIKYSYEELMEDLKCTSRTTVSNNIKDLEKFNLIEKVRCFSSSSIYYLKVRSTEDCTSTESCTDRSTEDCTTISTEVCTDSSTELLYASKNNFNKNNYKKNNNTHTEETEKPEEENSNNDPVIIQQILKKYKELGLPEYKYRPDNYVILEAYNNLGAKKLLEALKIMSESEFVKNNLSINTIFKLDNLKKALNGNFKDKVTKGKVKDKTQIKETKEERAEDYYSEEVLAALKGANYAKV